MLENQFEDMPICESGKTKKAEAQLHTSPELMYVEDKTGRKVWCEN